LTTALYLAACVFALANGTNTGSTLLATSLTLRSVRPGAALVLVMAGVAAGPLAGTGVATTLAGELVRWDSPSSRLGMLIAVLTSILVVLTLSRLRIPTSLTLALLGGIAGSGVTLGEPVAWSKVVFVLGMMALAPIVGGVIVALLIRIVAPSVRTGNAGRALRHTHVLAFSFLAFSYGANDGQKMLAVFAVAAGPVSGAVPLVWWQLGACALLFGAGTMLGVARMSRTVNTGVLPARPLDLLTTEVATGGAMLLGSAVGAPVGMAQTLSGSLVGAGLAQGMRRVRWNEASRIATAWLATLPVAFGLSALAGAAVSLV
jgi:PiT family inorganic phosphate transporter